MAPRTNIGTEEAALTRAVRPSYQAYRILCVTYILLPIVAGFDKFLHVLVDWNQYLAPWLTRLLPVDVPTFMRLVGVVEITAGILVAVRPRLGAVVVAVWLWGIILNLFLIPNFFDVALRDFGLSLGALALARLSREYGPSQAAWEAPESA